MIELTSKEHLYHRASTTHTHTERDRHLTAHTDPRPRATDCKGWVCVSTVPQWGCQAIRLIEADSRGDVSITGEIGNEHTSHHEWRQQWICSEGGVSLTCTDTYVHRKFCTGQANVAESLQWLTGCHRPAWRLLFFILLMLSSQTVWTYHYSVGSAQCHLNRFPLFQVFCWCSAVETVGLAWGHYSESTCFPALSAG